MAQMKKKSNKRKRISSFSSSRAENPTKPQTLDFDWWTGFWLKNSGPQVPDDEDEAFKHFFHLSKQTFSYICSLVQEDLISRPPSGLINIEGRLLAVDKQVAIALRRLASGDSQVSVGAAFGIGQSTVSQMTWRFVESMEDRARHHLRWPSQSEFSKVKSTLEANFSLPNCCGAIGTTKVLMTLPAIESSEDWRDEDGNYSMLTQAVVDHELKFIDITTGWPGGLTQAQLLKSSGLFKLCEAGERLNASGSGESSKVQQSGTLVFKQGRLLNACLDNREYIVGDQAYPLLPWLMNSCEGLAGLAAKAFGCLKGTWRILHKEVWRPDKHKLPSLILVCCLLHNIMVDCGDELQ